MALSIGSHHKCRVTGRQSAGQMIAIVVQALLLMPLLCCHVLSQRSQSSIQQGTNPEQIQYQQPLQQQQQQNTANVQEIQRAQTSSQQQLNHHHQQQLPQQQQQPQSLAQLPPTSTIQIDSPVFRFLGHATSPTSVKLIWSLSGNRLADHFDIVYGPIPENTQSFVTGKINGTTRDYTFNDLIPDTLYEFQLRAYQGDRHFKPSHATVRTLSANYKNVQESVNKDIIPSGVKAEAKSTTSIQLSWTEQEKPSNIWNSIRGNMIRYYVNTSNQAPQYHYLNITNPRDSKLVVQKLKPAVEYAFAVKTIYYSPDMKKIFTQSGYSMDTFAQTFDIEPSPPRNFSINYIRPTKEELLNGDTGKLELSWMAPEALNGQLQSYIILHALEPMAAESRWVNITVNDTSITKWYLSSPKPGQNYYFKMRAINQKGPSGDSEVRHFIAPTSASSIFPTPPPANNVLSLIVICMVAIVFLLFLLVSGLACRPRRKPRKGSLSSGAGQSKTAANGALAGAGVSGPKLSGFASTNSSTVAARVGTLARRRDNAAAKPEFWISALDQSGQAPDLKSEKSANDLNMAMVSIQRDSPQFATTQLAPPLPDYHFALSQATIPTSAGGTVNAQQLLQQIQQQSHYHPGQFTGSLAYDQLDNPTANALLTLSKRQQQQMQKYQIQFAATGVGPPTSLATGTMGMNATNQPLTQAPSPQQQPPPPPPLNIEQQQQTNQPLYGTHSTLAHTRSLRLHRPTLYDPVSGSFVQSNDMAGGPPNYSSHQGHQTLNLNPMAQLGATMTSTSNTLQYHPHQASTLMSRRSTNSFRSFQNSTYGQLGGANQFVSSLPPISSGNQQQPQQLLQSHQAVINQLNNSNYPSLPLKHVSAVRPQIMSSLKDQIEMELSEKEQQSPQMQSQSQQGDQQQQQTTNIS